jgi:CspA family cold shock protein
MDKGTIKRLTDRGFGFIEIEGSDKDLFFHSNELKNVEFNDLKEGDKVTFEIAEGPKGQNAVNVNKEEEVK